MVSSRLLSSAILLILTSLSASSSQKEEEGETYDCVNPKGVYGKCIILKECASLARILDENPINRESIRFLQASTCGYTDDKSPQVCCPEVSSSKSSGIDNDTLPSQNISQATQKTKIDTPPTQQNSSLITTEKPPEHPSGKDNHTESSSQSTESPKKAFEKIIFHENLHLLPSVNECGNSTFLTQDRIVGGRDAGLGKHPWIALLGFTDGSDQVQYACGGTLISKRYVITAAHCVTELPSGFRLISVKIGEYDQRTDPDCLSSGVCAPKVQNMAIDKIIPHEHFDETNKKENDIALIRLQQDVVQGEFVTPICLPRGEKIKTDRNISFVVAGFGRLIFDDPEGSSVLQEVIVPVISSDKCNEFYADKKIGKIDDSRFCAGGQEKRDSCKGDSGGPLMAALPLESSNLPRVFQFGIVSIGPSHCGVAGQPALYTRVSHYMPWILDHIRP